MGWISGSGRSAGGGHGNSLQNSCLENPMDRGDWHATVYGVARVGHDLVTKPPPPTPVFLPGESHGQRNLAGYSPWGCKEWDIAK